MPYPNEHAARLQDPGTKKISARRSHGSGKGKVQGVKVPASIDVIWFIIRTRAGGEAPVAQSLRFPTSNWGKNQTKARNWLKNHKIKFKKFEAAKQEKQSMADDTQYECECIKCGHTESYGDHCSEHTCSECGGQMRRADRPGPGQEKQSRQSMEKVPAAALRFSDEDAGVTVLAAKGNDGKPRFRMVANSGKVINGHPYWGNLAIDMNGVKIGSKKKPALRDHDTAKIVGWTEDIVADEKAGIIAQGVFSETTSDGIEAMGLAAEKFPWQASIYIPPSKIERVAEGEEVEVNGQKMKGPGTVFRKTNLREVSFCALGADERTSAVAMSEGDEIELEVEVIEGESVTKEIEMELTIETLRKEHADLCEQIATEAADKLKGEVDGKVAEALGAEKTRVKGILEKAKEFEAFDVAMASIEADETVEQVDLKLKDIQIQKLKDTSVPSPGPNDPPEDDVSLAGLSGDELYEAELKKNPKLADDFMDRKDYFAFRRAEDRGAVKILHGK